MSSPALQPRIRVPRAAQEAVAKARLSVVPRMRSRAPRVPFVMLVTVVLVGGVVGLLLFNTSLQQASFAASALSQRADSLAAREQTLRMELDELRDPQRVATQAQRMGMVIPPAPAYLDLASGEVSGVRMPAVRENALNLAPRSPVKPAVLAPRPKVVTVTASPTPKGQSGTANTRKAKDRNKSGRR